MAAIVGTRGIVSFGTDAEGTTADDFQTGGAPVEAEHALLAYRWTMNLVGETFDVTTFHDSDNFRKSIRGEYTATGTVEGFLASDVPHDLTPYQTPTALSSFVLTVQPFGVTDHTYSFDGFITGMNVTVDAHGVNRYTATFESTGEIAEADGSDV
jgi:hypothetical protein